METKLSKELAEARRKAEAAYERVKELEQRAEAEARQEWDRAMAQSIKKHRIYLMKPSDVEKEHAAMAVKYGLTPEVKASAKAAKKPVAGSAQVAAPVAQKTGPGASSEAGNAS